MKKDLKSLIILFKAHQSLEHSVKVSLLNTGINVNEFTAMEALYVKGPLTIQALINTVLIPNSSMTYVLDNLSKKKYIQKTEKPEDRRIHIVSLTVKGKVLFEEIYERHYEYIRSIFDVLSVEEETLLQELLKRVGKKAKEGLL